MAHKQPYLHCQLYRTALCLLITFFTCVNALGSGFVQFYIQKLIMAMRIVNKSIELSNCVDTSPPPFSSSIYSLWHHLVHWIVRRNFVFDVFKWTVSVFCFFLNLHTNCANWIFHTFRDWPFKIFGIGFIRHQQSVWKLHIA